MEVAAIGLLGVIVGATITSVFEWVMSRRNDSQALLAAVRLVLSDLYKTQALIRPVRDTGAWGVEFEQLPMTAWNEHASILARTLNRTDWKQIEGAMLGIARLEAIRSSNGPSGDTEEADFQRIGAWVDDTILRLDAIDKDA